MFKLLSLIASLALRVNAADWFVSSSGTDGSCTSRGTSASAPLYNLKTAVGCAANGDRIVMAGGVYYYTGAITFTGRKLTVVPDQTSGVPRIEIYDTKQNFLYFNGSNTLTFQGIAFSGYNSKSNYVTPGITNTAANKDAYNTPRPTDKVTFDSCTFENFFGVISATNTASRGIYGSFDTLSITNCNFPKSTTYPSEPSPVSLVYASSALGLTVSGSVFSQPTTSGMIIDGSFPGCYAPVTITNNRFENSHSAAVYVVSSLSAWTLDSNVVTGTGGGVTCYVYSTSSAATTVLTIKRGMFDGLTAAALNVNQNCTSLITESTISHVTLSSVDAAVKCASSGLTVTNVDFSYISGSASKCTACPVVQSGNTFTSVSSTGSCF